MPDFVRRVLAPEEADLITVAVMALAESTLTDQARERLRKELKMASKIAEELYQDGIADGRTLGHKKGRSEGQFAMAKTMLAASEHLETMVGLAVDARIDYGRTQCDTGCSDQIVGRCDQLHRGVGGVRRRSLAPHKMPSSRTGSWKPLHHGRDSRPGNLPDYGDLLHRPNLLTGMALSLFRRIDTNDWCSTGLMAVIHWTPSASRDGVQEAYHLNLGEG
ncbi:MAG: hypothetical protein M0Z36_11660 [Thermaerobacter sp.]|nr:hypothetical protein [Thermaerobacter sp.]